MGSPRFDRLPERRTLLVGAAALSVVAVFAIAAFWLSRDAPATTADAALAVADPAEAETTTAPTAPTSTIGVGATTSIASSTTTAATTTSTTSAPSDTTSTTTTTTIEPNLLPTLVQGDTGIEVLLLQRMLNVVTGSDIAADGTYGSATVVAVENFQRVVSLPVTGEADHETQMILKFIDAGRSTLLPSWPLPTIGDGGADGCQVAMVGDSLMAGAQRLHADRLGEIGCASAVDGVGGRSMAFGWQCRVVQPDGRRRLLLLPEPEPGNTTCAPSGLELLRMWSDARALGDVVVLALGTNDATLFADGLWVGKWEQVFAYAGTRPVVVVTTQGRPGSQAAPAQAAYSEALRQWCATVPRCVLADWALTTVANDAASYVDSVHLTYAATNARASFIRDVVGALLTGRPIPNPSPLPTPTTTLPPATTTTSTSTLPATSSATTSTSVPTSTTTTSTTSTTTTSTTSTSTSTSTSTTSTSTSTTTTTTTEVESPPGS